MSGLDKFNLIIDFMPKPFRHTNHGTLSESVCYKKYKLLVITAQALYELD